MKVMPDLRIMFMGLPIDELVALTDLGWQPDPW